ncbi:Uncharacterised protein [Halioglobus japonicus]|nr:Uncharacterised protein [Halioglobus japonicus]
MKAIVHIGIETTGTSFIQRYLDLNREKLRSAGYHFIQSAGELNNHAVPAYCVSSKNLDDYFRGVGITTVKERAEFETQFKSEFETELGSLPKSVHTVLISSEHFHSRIESAADMDNVYRLLSSYFDDIKIVCYLREQVTTCTKSYSTFLKSGGRDSFQKYLEKCNPGKTRYNYLDMLKNWERCFGRDSLDVSLFAKDSFLNGSLLDDFTAKIGPSLVGTLDQNVQLENDSLRPAGQILMRAINLSFPLQSKVPEVAEVRRQCKELISRKMAGKGQQPGLEIWQSIYDSFIVSNEKLRQEFFPDTERLFGEPFEMELPRNVIDEEFTELSIEVVSLIRDSGIDIQMPRAYSRFWSVISTCVTDVANFQEVDIKTGPSPVTLSKKDGHMLKNVSINIEKSNRQAAIQLMTLAARVIPNSNVIQKKMAEYLEAAGKNKKSKFLVTYHGGEMPSNSRQLQQLSASYERWLLSLGIESKGAVVQVKDNKVLQANDVPPCANHAPMTGYTIFQAESLDRAIALAKKCPHLELGGTVEVSEISELAFG